MPERTEDSRGSALPPSRGSVVEVSPAEAKARGLVCCPNPYCWNGKVGDAMCGVCRGKGVNPVWWRIKWTCDSCHLYPCRCAEAVA